MVDGVRLFNTTGFEEGVPEIQVAVFTTLYRMTMDGLRVELKTDQLMLAEVLVILVAV